MTETREMIRFSGRLSNGALQPVIAAPTFPGNRLHITSVVITSDDPATFVCDIFNTAGTFAVMVTQQRDDTGLGPRLAPSIPLPPNDGITVTVSGLTPAAEVAVNIYAFEG